MTSTIKFFPAIVLCVLTPHQLRRAAKRWITEKRVERFDPLTIPVAALALASTLHLSMGGTVLEQRTLTLGEGRIWGFKRGRGVRRVMMKWTGDA
ncbi:hypothetical protein TELCIR_18469 [Teladorsagia circumcincta]|uniref:Uncharacterized protein n=1 Tax=Teladorsagia circumcincta TaxID=45464 RepID=A0A2G9TRF7_TELCI|nr:hypothetical protein TELCIR_18469 [Teladorsagia circumcincta]